jgi:hypothetical protein
MYEELKIGEIYGNPSCFEKEFILEKTISRM